MSAKDIIKKSVLEYFEVNDVSVDTIFVTLGITCVLAIYVFIVYYMVTKKTFYQKTFNISLMVMATVTASIVLAMQSNLVISLGMVGALSIVRFRTAIKDPLDLAFLFWGISIGIICGAGLFIVAIATSIIATILIIGFDLLPIGCASKLRVVNLKDAKTEEYVMKIVKENAKNVRVKSRKKNETSYNMIIECRVKEENKLICLLTDMTEVYNVAIFSHDGEAVF